jgi:uncharacterized protein (TIGR03545 family)
LDPAKLSDYLGEIAAVRGLFRSSPVAAAALVAGAIAIAGAPPFAVFVSELSILKAGMTSGQYVAVSLLALFIVVVVLAWVLFVDRLIRLGIEAGGTAVNGAKVELASARLRLFQGELRLRGLQVTDAEQPMRNLFAVDEIELDLGLKPLLEKKFDAETVAVRGLTFGGARKTSGALPKKTKAPAVETRDSVRGWAQKVPLPALDLGNLGKALDIKGVSQDSLQSLAMARSLTASGDSLKTALEARVTAANPRPVVDSAQALARRLSGTDVRRLGLAGARDAAAQVRTELNAIKAQRDKLTALQNDVAGQVGALRTRAAALDQARAADYAYARRLVKLPSLDPKDLATSLVGRSVLERLVPQLAYLRILDHRLPAGLKPQMQAGPKRARMAGTTFVFPKLHRYPTLLLEFAEGTFTLPGRTTAAGDYAARLTGVTTEPAVYGKPLTFLVDRSGAVAVGPKGVHIAGTIDRTGDVPRDTVVANLAGVGLPALDLAVAGARVDLRTGDQTLAFSRYGDTISGRWYVRSDSVSWSRPGQSAAPTSAAGAPLGSQAWLDALVWGAVASLKNVEIEARIHGRLSSPSFDVSSNIGGAVSGALGKAVAAEVQRAETAVRAKVDSLVGQQVSAARAKLASLDTGPLKSLADDRSALDGVQSQLEQRLRTLTVGGIRLP